MKNHPALRHGLLALSMGLAALPAWAEDDCDAPLKRWQTREAVQAMAAEKGWQIQRLKIDDGCYEIRGKDAQGNSFKAKVDPETLKILKMKEDDRQRIRKLDRDDAKTAHPPQSPQPDGAAEPPPLQTPNAWPDGQRN